MQKTFISIITCLIIGIGPAYCEDIQQAETAPVSTVSTALNENGAENDTTVNIETPKKKKNIFKKIGDYFAKSNKFDPNKKMDFSIIGGPHYSSATGLGIGLVASGLYRLDKTDPTLPISNMSIFGNATTSGFLMIGVKGNNIFKHEKYRLDYATYVYLLPSDFWGIGYDNGDIDENKSKYTRFKFEVKPKFLFRLAKNIYLGPMVNFQYVNNTKIEDRALELLDGRDTEFLTFGAGASFIFDSRDNITNPHRGWFAQIDQLCFPSFFGNDNEYHFTELTASTYFKGWKGAIIAAEVHSLFNYNDVPWPMLASVGGVNRMRGYYEGRYRDNNILEGQIEIRQHIWKRNGAVLWFGAANVFPKFNDIHFDKTLWNVGVGYRWAFKENVNVRLDLGLTKNGMGFLFNINEAF